MCSYPEATFCSTQAFGTDEGPRALGVVAEPMFGGTGVVVVFVVVVVAGVLKVPRRVGCAVEAGSIGGSVKGTSVDPELSITTSVTFRRKYLKNTFLFVLLRSLKVGCLKLKLPCMTFRQVS